MKIIFPFLLLAQTASYSAVCLNSIQKSNDFESTVKIASFSTNFDTENPRLSLNEAPPVIIASGNQYYCPGTSMKIVTDVTITDPDDTGIGSIYIQISSGYVNGEDQLRLMGTHPAITSNWNADTGKLELSSSASGTKALYTDLVSAIKDVEFSNSTAAPSGNRTFSIVIDETNYLSSNGHHYEFISDYLINWTDAKIAAETKTYYGRKGYLVTITDAEEAAIAGKLTSGAGWIGGSDEGNEGKWYWVTGPEKGTLFWDGRSNGSTPNFAFWNAGEPNNVDGSENYAHITKPGPLAILGSWNDLPNTGGGINPDYHPQGYIVEYGGMPGDSPINVATSTSMTIISFPEIINVEVNTNNIIINVKNPQSYYEYSVDGINYQSSNIFFNVRGGLQTAYVRGFNSCGTDSEIFFFIKIPPFFTPNNDSYNDFWEIEGLIDIFPEAEVTIFDRYGKFIIKLDGRKLSWDGTYNKKLMPATDYWYVLKIDAVSPERRGHFSLKR
ncbi:T9SS type B sorting domain-containing protein [Flavobacterium caseinilyticum]|uniref:T9SS type B sorting domain-containing protein n=1 Tax=Flavobacterium caseinilyticum TaxID=2541732 RepID=UPI001FB59A75|nr:T9SS type B sorting domain-containing protein [Flavobacterium caseinilyticum]